MKNEKKKGGKRSNAGRKPSQVKKEAVTIYVDVSKFGGKAGARMAIYEFVDGDINLTNKKSFLPLPESALVALHNAENKGQLTEMHLLPKKKAEALLKSQEQPKTNYSVNTTPKTLDELKSRCPAELTGFDRSNWIATERQKYSI